MNELVWEGGILEFRRSLIGARANKTLVPSNAITLPIYYVVIYSKTIFITIPSTLSCSTNTRDTHTHTHTQLYKFVPSLLFFSLIFTFDTKFYLDLLLVELQSQDFPIYSYARIQSKSLSIDIFAKRFHLEIFIYKHASSNENLLENYIFCINVKPLCQTSIGERCHYEMAAFKAGEFVETTARPKAFRGIYIYIYSHDFHRNSRDDI